MANSCICANILTVVESTSGPEERRIMKGSVSTTRKQLRCEDCGRDYWDKRSLDRHTRENHGEEPLERLPCDKCDKTFKNKNSLDKHVRNVHQKKKAKDPEPDPEPTQQYPTSSAAIALIHATNHLIHVVNIQIREAECTYYVLCFCSHIESFLVVPAHQCGHCS